MPRLFIDMDGTLTRFYDDIVDDDGSVQLAKMYKPNFFLDLKPDMNLLSAVKELACRRGIELFIVSAYDHSHPNIELQKLRWLDKHLPEVDDCHRVFTVIGESKAKFIDGGVKFDDVLVDDYNLNLRDWVDSGGVSIKYVNDLNHKGSGKLKGDVGNVWTGPVVDHDWDPDRIIAVIDQIVDDAKAV